MKKIPVAETIRFAYNFTFGHLGTIIGLIWLPMVIIAVAGYFVTSYYYGAVPEALSAGDPLTVGRSGLLVIGWSLVSMLLYAMMYTAVTEEALGRREGAAVVHFHIGGAEIRVFGVFLALVAIALLFLLADGAVLAMFQSLAAKVPAMMAAGVLVYIAGLLASLYALVRLSFLAVPAAVVEEKRGISRAWELSKGNFWRIAAIGLATLLPLLLILGVTDFAILGPGFFMPHVTPAGADAAQRTQALAEQMRAAAPHLPLISGMTFLFAPFVTGLTVAPAAYAYRALTGRDGLLNGAFRQG